MQITRHVLILHHIGISRRPFWVFNLLLPKGYTRCFWLFINHFIDKRLTFNLTHIHILLRHRVEFFGIDELADLPYLLVLLLQAHLVAVDENADDRENGDDAIEIEREDLLQARLLGMLLDIFTRIEERFEGRFREVSWSINFSFLSIKRFYVRLKMFTYCASRFL